MAFLRRSRKNVPAGTDEISMKATMWRYRDVSKRDPIISLVLRRPWGTGRPRLIGPPRAHCPEATYIAVHEIPAQAWGYAGKPQDTRRQLKQAS